MKKIGIHSGNISYVGQEKMLIEFLKILDKQKYKITLFIEEDKGQNNIYIGEIPEYVNYKFMNSNKLIKKIEEYKQSKNPIKKIIRSYLLKKKKIVSIKKIEKELSDLDLFIDYDMGLLRNLHKLDKKNKRIIAWSHAGNGGLAKKYQARKNILLYDDIVSINGVMKDGYDKNYKDTQINMHKIYNFIDDSKIKELSLEILEENLGKYILNVGSLTKNKNQEEIILAFEEILQENKDLDVNLVIIGEGKEREKLENLIKKLNLSEKVFLLGNKINPYKYMKNSEFYIQSSYSEGFPMVMIEAMTLGKGIISSKTNGGLEITKNGKYGIIYESKEKLKENIINFLKNEEIKKTYEKLSLERVQDFSREKIKKEIENLIEGE